MLIVRAQRGQRVQVHQLLCAAGKRGRTSAIVDRPLNVHVQLFSVNRGDEYLPSTLPTPSGTLFWSVVRQNSPEAVIIKVRSPFPLSSSAGPRPPNTRAARRSRTRSAPRRA